MFAAMSEQPDFFKERMNLLVAISPLLYISNTYSKTLQ